MRAGRLRDRITIERLKTAAEGAVVDQANVIAASNPANWTTHCTRYAEVTETGGREQVGGRHLRATTSHLVVLRADDDTREITSRMRVVWNGQTLQIAGKAVNRRDVELECETKA